jgi:hypothetical protein
MLKKIDSTLFDWQTWRAGTLLDLNCFNRFYSIIENEKVLKKYAIGFCKAEELNCRPKQNCFAVMFEIENKRFWTHIREQEFKKVFCDF